MKKVQFEFTDETYDAINRLGTVTGERSMAAVMRNALKVYSWLVKEQQGGRKIVSVDPKNEGSTRELVYLITPVEVS